jgi:site-specific recombinase XerD
VDFDNMLLKVKGKDNKLRLVPNSPECRKVLFRAANRHEFDLIFATRNGTLVTPRNFLRDFKLLGGKRAILGVRLSPHTLRHTFAINFLQSGGDIYMLSRILGHSSVKTTEVYLKSLGVEALQVYAPSCAVEALVKVKASDAPRPQTSPLHHLRFRIY